MRRKLIGLLLLFMIFSEVMAINIGKKIRINGYSSFEYEKQIGDDGDGDKNGSFDADLFDLVFNFNATKRLRVAADLTWEHGSATEDALGNVAVEYAFPEYTIQPWLKLRAGKMFVPFGIYNEIHTAKPATLFIKEPLSTNKPNKIGSSERFYPRWAVGLAALGNIRANKVNMDYIIQVSNGAQGEDKDGEAVNQYEEDNNPSKAVAGRYRIMPNSDLRFGVSGYFDRYGNKNGTDDIEYKNLYSLGVQAELHPGDFGFEAEFVYGEDEVADETRWGMNTLVSYTLADRFTPYFLFEYLDPNVDLDDDGAIVAIPGVNIQLDIPIFLKFEVDFFNFAKNNSEYSEEYEGKYSEFKAAIAVGF